MTGFCFLDQGVYVVHVTMFSSLHGSAWGKDIFHAIPLRELIHQPACRTIISGANLPPAEAIGAGWTIQNSQDGSGGYLSNDCSGCRWCIAHVQGAAAGDNHNCLLTNDEFRWHNIR